MNVPAFLLILGMAVMCCAYRLEAFAASRLQRRRAADIARLTAACEHMRRSADGFRELYLRELARNRPDMADHLRRKWAVENAPLHVAQLLERAKHG